MTIDDAIERELYRTEANREMADSFHTDKNIYLKEEEAFRNREDYHSQIAEWLRELKIHREFADWLVKAVLEEGWEESADFYAEVLCRKLTKLGKLKVVDNKYMEVNADDGDSN